MTQYRFIPASPMSEEEADIYLSDLEEFHVLDPDRMRRENARAFDNTKLWLDILNATKSGTKQ